jgi:hypothetical protein
MIARWIIWLRHIWTGRSTVPVSANLGVAAGRDIRDSPITIIQTDNKPVLDAITTLREETLSRLSKERGVPIPVLQQILAGFGEHDIAVDTSQIEQNLRAM